MIGVSNIPKYINDYNVLSPLELESIYNTPYSLIRNRIKSLRKKGYSIPSKKTTVYQNEPTLSNAEIINLYCNGTTTKEIAKISKITKESVWRILKKNNVNVLSVGKSNKVYNINEDYFEKIDTPNKAYVLGFIYADGYNNRTNNSLVIGLQERDANFLELIKNEIGTNRPLKFTKRNKSVCLTISNKKISDDLVKLGVIPNKSLSVKFPNENILPKYLYSHFIRGVFDGDGCLHINENTRVKSFSIVGNNDFISAINKFLQKELKLNLTQLIYDKKHNENVVSLRYSSTSDLYKLYNYLYNESELLMERKKAKFDIFLSVFKDKIN